MSDNIERKVLAVLQGGFPLTKTPYEDMAKQVGIETSQLLKILENWKKEGKLRRIGAIVNHFQIGRQANAMVVWQVEPQRSEEVGSILAEFEEVSHAYERVVSDKWPYNLYTMIHGTSVDNVKEIVQKMSQACGVSQYRILFTDRELKKVPPTYISQ